MFKDTLLIIPKEIYEEMKQLREREDLSTYKKAMLLDALLKKCKEVSVLE